jgi:DNA-binding NarL/FixJ family response regulator
MCSSWTLRLGDGDGEGLELMAVVMREHPKIRIIALSQFDEDIQAHRALKAGARGYLMKSEATEAVLTAIGTMLRGGIHLSPRMAGRSTLEIGAELRISPKTVEMYRENLKVKLSLRNAPALWRAATLWVESGALETEDFASP